jgi:hypothetical protein
MIGRLYCAGFGMAAGVISGGGSTAAGLIVFGVTVIIAFIWDEVH